MLVQIYSSGSEAKLRIRPVMVNSIEDNKVSYSLEEFYDAADQQKDHSPFCTVVKGWGHNRYYILEGWWEANAWRDYQLNVLFPTNRAAVVHAKNWARLNDLQYIEKRD